MYFVTPLLSRATSLIINRFRPQSQEKANMLTKLITKEYFPISSMPQSLASIAVIAMDETILMELVMSWASVFLATLLRTLANFPLPPDVQMLQQDK